MSEDRCENCGGAISQFGRSGCRSRRHPKPDQAEKIVIAIEAELLDRRGIKQTLRSLDDETRDELRQTLAKRIRRFLPKE